MQCTSRNITLCVLKHNIRHCQSNLVMHASFAGSLQLAISRTCFAALQVAVHNVPFKWCNDDLEELFRQQEGYMDAQLLFHENGRSKVGTLCAWPSASAMQQHAFAGMLCLKQQNM